MAEFASLFAVIALVCLAVNLFFNIFAKSEEKQEDVDADDMFFFDDKKVVKEKKKVAPSSDSVLISLLVALVSLVLGFIPVAFLGPAAIVGFSYFKAYKKASDDDKKLTLTTAARIFDVAATAAASGSTLKSSLQYAVEASGIKGSTVGNMLDNALAQDDIKKYVTIIAEKSETDQLKVFGGLLELCKTRGANVYPILMKASSLCRTREEFLGYVKAKTNSGKIQGYIVSSIVYVCLLIMIVSAEEFRNFYLSVPGIIVVVIATVLVLIGNFAISKIVKKVQSEA